MGTPSGEPPAPRRSRLLDYIDVVDYDDVVDRTEVVDSTGVVDEAPSPGPGTARAPGPRPGVPAYHTPVFVPAHPRAVPGTAADGRPVRAPFIAYELFAHSGGGTVALAFTGLDRLVAVLGDAQPWVATSLGPLAEVMAERELTVRLDPVALAGRPHWQPAELAAYAREMR
ncbi:SAV_915 family protein [Streptomyces sp. NPDC050095]|uniref:SAV_915 family protein n=1 Tax=unclassified Streptomyces TaxID=2593676 RepID=UPI00342BE784